MHQCGTSDGLFGFYRGIVLKHLSYGNCKIWIPGVYPKEWKSPDKADCLPTAEQASSLAFGANNGLGIFSYPNINSIVWCFFENGNRDLPVYFASTLGGQKAMATWNEARPMAGAGDSDAYVHKIAVKDSTIEIYETGVIKVKTGKDAKQCKLDLDADGNITLESDSTLTLKSKQILIDAETQVDIKAPNITNSASIHYDVKSPAINVDATGGSVKITTNLGTKFFA